MYYTDFEKKEIFEDRQAAILSSREKDKKAFVNSVCNPVITFDENGLEYCYIEPKGSYDEIAKNFELYQDRRNIVYEVHLKELWPKIPF